MKIVQNLIYQIKEVIDAEFGVTDDNGLIIGCSDESRVGTTHPGAVRLLQGREPSAVFDGISFKKVYMKNKLEFITYINSNDSSSHKYLSLISINLLNIRNYYEEKFDKSIFFRDIITGNIPAGDIALKANELHLNPSAFRVVFLLKTGDTGDAYSHYVTLTQLFPNRSKDFVILLDDRSTVLVKELKSAEDGKEVDRAAKSIIDTLNTELMIKAQVGIGTIVNSLMDIKRSFREAMTAIQVGSIFENDREIADYGKLGIGRLIYLLPPQVCSLFLKEVFGRNTFDSIDAETLMTVQKFFENNLNVSETSRQLYVHRNTLVYRLDKVQKLTGLDLKNFDDAITFKVSMLVKRYLDKRVNLDQTDL